jgi:hypothetical protein
LSTSEELPARRAWAAEVVGAWLLGDESAGSFRHVALTHSGRLPETPQELPRGEALGQVALLHVMGNWSFAQCGITFGGGHGHALLSDCFSFVDLEECLVGGLPSGSGDDSPDFSGSHFTLALLVQTYKH